MNIENVIEELKKVNPEWDGEYDYDDDIKFLNLENTNISDLTPLKGMPLKFLYLENTNISDLTPLKGMPLEGLNLDNTNVSDLTPLKGMPLKLLYLDNMPAAEKSLPEWLDGVDVYGWAERKTMPQDSIQSKMDKLDKLITETKVNIWTKVYIQCLKAGWATDEYENREVLANIAVADFSKNIEDYFKTEG